MRVGHRFYIERDGSLFNMPNVHRFPRKNFFALFTHLKLHYGVIQLLIQRHTAVVPLAILYTLATNIMFNQFLLRQPHKFRISIGYFIILK